MGDEPRGKLDLHIVKSWWGKFLKEGSLQRPATASGCTEEEEGTETNVSQVLKL